MACAAKSVSERTPSKVKTHELIRHDRGACGFGLIFLIFVGENDTTVIIFTVTRGAVETCAFTDCSENSGK